MEIPKVEELLRSLMQGLPPGLASGASGLREDLENNFRAVLRANLGKLDLAGARNSMRSARCWNARARGSKSWKSGWRSWN